MTSVPYVKGVRTRYKNILAEDVKKGKKFIQYEIYDMENDDALFSIETLIKKIQSYIEKLEKQTAKLADVLSETDPENSEQLQTLAEEDTELISEASDLQFRLESLREKFRSEKETHEPSPDYKEIINMQHEFQNLVVNQIKQQNEQMSMQQEYFDRQEKKEFEKAKTVKLPKLDLSSFNGDKLKWRQFWDTFNTSVHTNKNIPDVQKFNYLLGKLYGEARYAISGLELSGDNYHVAIKLLHERFGNTQEVVDLHYRKLINMQSASNNVTSLRYFLDTVEKHLRSLEVLHKDVNQDVFISMIRDKLPEAVLLQLELFNTEDSTWTLDKFRQKLKAYIVARERSEKKNNTDKTKAKPITDGAQGNTDNELKKQTHGPVSGFGYRRPANMFGPKRVFQNEQSRVTSGEALVTNDVQRGRTNSNSNKDYSTLCRYCENRHWSDECPKYRTIEERKRLLRGSCYICLKLGHKSSDCKRGKLCAHCGERNSHHRSLCPTKFGNSATISHLSGEVNDDCTNDVGACGTVQDMQNPTTENGLASFGEMILMQTVKAKVYNPQNGKEEEIRILLDSGSQRSYVTDSLAKRLDLKSEGSENINVMTFGSDKSKNVTTKISSMQIKVRSGEKVGVSVNIVPVISGTIHRKPVRQLSENASEILKTVELADTITKQHETCEIDMLLGNDYYLDIVLCQKLEIQPGLYLLSSRCGWILTGRIEKDDKEDQDVNMLILTHGDNLTKTNSFSSVDKDLPITPNLEDFWKVESIGIMDNPDLSNDEKVMTMFRDTLTFSEGRYQVKWPWKYDIPDLPTNKELAYGRLKSVVTKLQKKPDLMVKYNGVIQDQLEKGIIEQVNKGSPPIGPVHYLPHHAVLTPTKSTTKLRIVYDASAKTTESHKSLNENLYRGPVMLHDLCGILMRFRLHKIAIVADIEKAFLQIGLQPSERDVTRFLWIKCSSKPITEKENLIEYRFCRVPFGVISSPFLLGATVEYHLESNNTPIANKLKNDIYVDNIVTGTNSQNEAVELYQSAKSIFNEISMNLREWITNDSHVNSSIQSKDRADSNGMKVLGHDWDITTDTISIRQSIDNINEKSEEKKETKRSILKTVASVFDPLGLCSPIVLKGKLLIQTLWSRGLDWDDEITKEETVEWQTLKNDLSKISDIKLHRCVTVPHYTEGESALACFSDASAKAYACAIYLHQELEGESIAELIMSKARLAPLKKMTIPKLEVMAVLIGVRCLHFVLNQMKLNIKRCFLWTDSQCVLHWIDSKKEQPVFVRNRISEIKTHKNIEFGFVRTSENPADIATRGTNTQGLQINNIWWHGPTWLSLPKSEWPKHNISHDKTEHRHDTVVEVDDKNQDQDMSNVCVKSETGPYGIDVKRFSSVTKLIRVTAYVSRFIRNIRSRTEKSYGIITSDELKNAEKLWLRHLQTNYYSEIISSILNGKPNNIQRQLGLYVDGEGILRCHGRLEHSDLTLGARHPILLPKGDYFTKLVIQKTHTELLHSGVSQTLSKLRQTYWIIRGRASVKTVLKKCLVCKRVEGGPYKMPQMPPLPKIRVSESVPFSRTGLDYLGPLAIKTENGEVKKVWVCLFTCLVTRAVHLEMIDDMTTGEFLMAFRRFISQRGSPEIVISDNALQFKTANKTLKNVLRNVVQTDDVQSYASNAKIKWHFIVELSPWMGGFYERLVGLVKRTLRKTIGRNLLTRMQIQTLLKESEAVLNSRPLVYLEDDINSCITITPSHFLSFNRNLSLPEVRSCDDDDEDYSPFESSETEILKLWKKGHRLLNSFWRIWRNDYLLSLRERTQSRLKSAKIQSLATPFVGEIVQIKDDLPRGCWKCGKIVELTKSFDGEIRSAKVRLPSGRIIGRPLNLLYPLETMNRQDTTEAPASNESKNCDKAIS